MSRRALNVLQARNPLPLATTSSPRRFVHYTPPRSNAVAASGAFPNAFADTSVDALHDFRFSELLDSLERDQYLPNRVWSYYQALLADVDATRVPADIHRRVLRRCAPELSVLRTAAARRYYVGNAPRTPHLHEDRFRAVIANLRTSGAGVALDDFHYVLRQFAAVGHHAGARAVLSELRTQGLAPDATTYALVLQALAHRLRLPTLRREAGALREQSARACQRLIAQMARERVPVTQACVDLAVRILRETEDAEGFDALLKTIYGVDLAAPVSGPTGWFAFGDLPGKGDVAMTSAPDPPLPLSVSALNTVVDTLGRSGRISKLVQAFEVLTNPLPAPQAEEELLQLDEDEEDDTDYRYLWASPDPHVQPNATTYNLLVKWTALAKDGALARHYAYEAVEADRLENERVIKAARHALPKDIEPPRVTANRRTLLPLVDLAHRTTGVLLMRWNLRIANRLIRQKTGHIARFRWWADKLHKDGLMNALPDVLPTDVQGVHAYLRMRKAAAAFSPARPDYPAPRDLDMTPVADSAVVAPPPSGLLPGSPENASAPSDPAGSSASPEETAPVRELPPHVQLDEPVPKQAWTPPDVDLSAFAVDVDASQRDLLAPKARKLKLEVHLALLARDVQELSGLVPRIERLLGRLIQRRKERAARRVWAGKDVFLRSAGQRVRIARAEWRKQNRWAARDAPPALRFGTLWTTVTHTLPPHIHVDWAHSRKAYKVLKRNEASRARRAAKRAAVEREAAAKSAEQAVPLTAGPDAPNVTPEPPSLPAAS
jgi:hypothetical protein